MLPDGAEALRTFWSRMKFHPGCRNHPLLDVPSFEERAIPINLHGVCVPITGIGKVWAKNLLALHWSSALCKGNSKDICLLTFTVLWMLFEWFLHFLQFLFWQHTIGSYFTSAIIGGYCLCTSIFFTFKLLLLPCLSRSSTNLPLLQKVAPWTLCGRSWVGALTACNLENGLGETILVICG